MRISSSFLYKSTTSQISKSLEKMYEASNTVSSGKAFDNPSDDPVAAMNSLRLNQSLRQVEKYLSIQEDIAPYLTMADSSLTSMNETIRSIKTDLANAANSTTTEDQLKTISSNVDFGIDNLIGLANTNYNNVYIFGGQKIDELPFERDGNKIIYNGSLNYMSSEASPGIDVEASTPGSNLFTVHTIESNQIFNDIKSPLSEVTSLSGIDLITIQSGDENPYSITIDYDSDSIEDIVNKINNYTDSNATLTKTSEGYTFSINSRYVGSQGTLKISDQQENGFFKYFNMSNAMLGSSNIENPDLSLTSANSMGIATGTYTFDIITQSSGTISFSVDSDTTTLSEVIEQINSLQESVTATLVNDGNRFTIGLESSTEDSEGNLLDYQPFTIRDTSSPGIINGLFGKDVYSTQDLSYKSTLELSSSIQTFDSMGLIGGPHTFNIQTDSGTTVINVDYSTDTLTSVAASINAIGNVTANIVLQNGQYTLDITGVDNESIIVEEVAAGFLNDLGFEMNQAETLTENDYRKYSLLDKLIDVKNELADADNSNITEASEAIINSLENILNIEFSIAYQGKRIETAKSLGEEQKFTLEEMIANAEEVDLTEAVNNLTLAQTAYQASLVSSTKVLGLSLLDYI